MLFKRMLNIDIPKVPAFFYTGDRKSQILHTRLRTNCSSLSLDLFNKNMIDSPLCECGEVESCYHYFFTCQRFVYYRLHLLNTVSRFCNPTLDVLLNGNNILSFDTNVSVFNAVHSFIRKSKRFT